MKTIVIAKFSATYFEARLSPPPAETQSLCGRGTSEAEAVGDLFLRDPTWQKILTIVKISSRELGEVILKYPGFTIDRRADPFLTK